jgi:ribosome recycling factor
MLQPIEKAIMIANLGFNPMNNGDVIIISVPPLTEERRRDLTKQAKGEAEDAKIGIRNARQEANKDIKKLEKKVLLRTFVKPPKTRCKTSPTPTSER